MAPGFRQPYNWGACICAEKLAALPSALFKVKVMDYDPEKYMFDSDPDVYRNYNNEDPEVEDLEKSIGFLKKEKADMFGADNKSK